MKRIVMILILMFCLSGCSTEKPDPIEAPLPSVEVIIVTDAPTPEPTPEPSITDYVPDPYELYTDDEFSFYSILDNDTQVSFMVKGLGKEGYLAMRKACRDKGFTDATSQTDTIYFANTEDGSVRLELSFLGDEEDGSINVCIYFKEEE